MSTESLNKYLPNPKLPKFNSNSDISCTRSKSTVQLVQPANWLIQETLKTPRRGSYAHFAKYTLDYFLVVTKLLQYGAQINGDLELMENYQNYLQLLWTSDDIIDKKIADCEIVLDQKRAEIKQLNFLIKQNKAARLADAIAKRDELEYEYETLCSGIWSQKKRLDIRREYFAALQDAKMKQQPFLII